MHSRLSPHEALTENVLAASLAASWACSWSSCALRAISENVEPHMCDENTAYQ
jgi:hypothetical protein